MQKEIEGQENIVREQILKSLNAMCNCELTGENIETGLFSCGQQDHQIIYRAHILGTINYSASDLVDLIHSWIVSSKAYITINNFRMQLDPTCPSRLDTLDDPECPVVGVATTSTETKPTDAVKGKSEKMTAAEKGGIYVGVTIVILLIIVIVILGIGFFFWKVRSSSSFRYKKQTNI